MNTSCNEFEAFFTKRWPEFEHDKSSAFEIWQAAQASVVVELPETFRTAAWNVMKKADVIKAIEASGARVKQ